MAIRTVAVNGNSLALSSIVATLQGRAGLRVVPVQHLGGSHPDAILFDLAASQFEFDVAWWKAQPNVLLIGVDLASNQMFVLSGQHPHLLTFDNLEKTLQVLPQGEPKGGYVTIKNRKYAWFAVAGAVLASLVVYLSLSWPPVSRNTVQGTIGQRDVYRQEQLTDKDVGVAGKIKVTVDDVRTLLRSPEFNTLAKDPQFQKMLAGGKSDALNNLMSFLHSAEAQANQIVSMAQTNQVQANQLMSFAQTSQARDMGAQANQLMSLAQANQAQANQLMSLARTNQSQANQSQILFSQVNQAQDNQIVSMAQTNQALANQLMSFAQTNQAREMGAQANQLMSLAQTNQAQANRLMSLSLTNQSQANQLMNLAQANQFAELAHSSQIAFTALANNAQLSAAYSIVAGSQVLQSLAQSGALSQAAAEGAVQNSIIQSLRF